MTSKPHKITSQVKYAPSGVDETAGILLQNKEDEMASIILSLHAKQPKRGTISFDKGYIEIFEYPRGDEAVITYTETGEKKLLPQETQKKRSNMKLKIWKAVLENFDMHLNFTKDVMDIMTFIRNEWGMYYPEEEGREIL